MGTLEDLIWGQRPCEVVDVHMWAFKVLSLS